MQNSQKFAIAGALVAALAISGCQNKDVGTLSGSVVGGLLASHIGGGGGKMLAIGLGTMAGAMLGGHIGQQLDEVQQKQVAHTANHSLEHTPDGQASTWRDPNQDVAATVIPVKTYQTSQGQYCREFQQKIEVAGKSENGYGKACRRPDGSWEIVA